jgi:hypothetical protein
MPNKIRRTKGRKLRENKTDRKESAISIRQAIVNTDSLTSSTQEAKK